MNKETFDFLLLFIQKTREEKGDMVMIMMTKERKQISDAPLDCGDFKLNISWLVLHVNHFDPWIFHDVYYSTCVLLSLTIRVYER